MEFTDGLNKEDFEIELRGMLKLMTFESKLPYIVFLDFENRIKRKNKFPRIFISINSVYKRIVPISIDKENPKILIDKEVPEFEIVKNWVIKHYDILMKYWNQEINGYQLFSELVIKKKNKHFFQYESDFNFLSFVANGVSNLKSYNESFTDNLTLKEFDEEIGEMSSLTSKESGLPYKILIDSLGKYRTRLNNSPRIMADLGGKYRTDNIVPILIDKEIPKILIDKEIPEFEIISNWIKKNYKILINHWNKIIDDYEALSKLVTNVDFKNATDFNFMTLLLNNKKGD